MKFKGLDGRIYSKQIDSTTHGVKEISRSEIQYRVGQELIKDIGDLSVLEEVPTLGLRPMLYLDFYIPYLNIAIEVQGEQHSKFNSHFHGDKGNFAHSRINDSIKAQWCEMNDIILMYITEEDLECLPEAIDKKIKEYFNEH